MRGQGGPISLISKREDGLMEYNPSFSEDEEEEVGLVKLSQVRYQLAEGQPDAMGWRVADETGIVFGTVADLLADTGTGQIVFAAVRSDATGKTSLVPVEGLFLDEDNDAVIVPASQSEIRESPDFTDEVVDVKPFVEYWLKLALARAQS